MLSNLEAYFYTYKTEKKLCINYVLSWPQKCTYVHASALNHYAVIIDSQLSASDLSSGLSETFK